MWMRNAILDIIQKKMPSYETRYINVTDQVDVSRHETNKCLELPFQTCHRVLLNVFAVEKPRHTAARNHERCIDPSQISTSSRCISGDVPYMLLSLIRHKQECIGKVHTGKYIQPDYLHHREHQGLQCRIVVRLVAICTEPRNLECRVYQRVPAMHVQWTPKHWQRLYRINTRHGSFIPNLNLFALDP